MLTETTQVPTLAREPRVGPRGPDPVELSSVRKGSAALTAGSFALLSGLLAYVAYFPMHNQFQSYDDEGYWLISLRSYHLHGSLYHETFAQVGPLYYEFWSLVYSITGLSIDPNTGRAFTLVIWVLTSAVFGIALLCLTGRVTLGLTAQVLSFLLLYSLRSEPMEPAGLAHLFVAFALLGLTIVHRGRWRLGMTLIGIFTMAAVLTKINVGLLMAGGVAYALLVCWPSDRFSRCRRVVGAGALLAIPILLMGPIIARPWVQRYLLIELFALAAIIAVIGIRRRTVRPVSIIGVAWCVGAATATSIVVTVGVLINGTSLSEFVGGAVLSQRGLADVATIPLPSTWTEVVIAGISATVALVVVLTRWVPGAAVRLVAGCWLAISIVGRSGAPTSAVGFIPHSPLAVPALAWIVLVPPSRAESPLSFERITICAAGVLGYLEAFPGAGSQTSWACLLLVPVVLLCISDGLDMLTTRMGHRTPSALRQRVASVSVLVAALVVLIPVGAPSARVLLHDRAHYYSQVPLGLPGAETLRLPSSEVAAFRAVTKALKANCSEFEGIPGVNSFYFFSGQDPPTGFNTTQWWKLLDAQQQQAAVTRLERTQRPCVLVNNGLILFWDATGEDSSLNRSPLEKFTRAHLTLFDTLGGYSLYVRNPNGGSATPTSPGVDSAT